jgi:DNA-binding LacI/PurR family transcriptional regulator
MGVDDIVISSIFIPSLITIRYPVKEMVDQASKILLERIKKPVSNKNKEIIIKTELIIRESTSPINKS